MSYILVFLAMVGVDFAYAEWAKACADRRTFWASSMAAVMIVLSGYVTTNYVSNPWMLVSAALGAFAGTWLSMKFGK